MTRLITHSAEEQSLSAVDSSTAGISIATNIVHAGLAAFRCLAASNTGYIQTTIAAGAAGQIIHTRLYLRIITLPSADSPIMEALQTALSEGHRIILRTNGTIRVTNAGGTQVGSDSSALELDRWYRIETLSNWDNDNVQLRIDGTQVFNATSSLQNWERFRFGLGCDAVNVTSGEWYLDDCAVNSNAGSSQNSWPGAGFCTILLPDASGETAAGTGTFADVDDDPPPPNTSDFIAITATAQTGWYNCQSSDRFGIAASDTINFVAVGMYQRNASATQASNRRVRIQSQNAGTKAESALVSNTGNTFNFHFSTGGTTPYRVYQLYQYLDPQAGGAWTKALLETMQIGFGNSTDVAPNPQCSWLWALVETQSLTGFWIEPPDPIEWQRAA